MDTSKLSPATKCLHTAEYDTSQYKGVTTPLFHASAYEYVGVDKYVYPRYYNTPNLEATEKVMAALEHAESAILFSSGMASVMTVLLTFLDSGDHIILQKDIYGGTYDAVISEFDRYKIEYTFVDGTAEAFEKATRLNTKIYFFESPSNPLLNIADMRSITDLATSRSILTVFDNTFASPINQNPHDHGVDIVIQSGTKYLGGHSDISSGVATMNQELCNRVRETGVHLGGNLDPQTAWLLERSLKTLALRVEKQTANATTLAKWMLEQEKIQSVFYPGLKSHPGHERAVQQMHGFGAMLSFEINEDPDEFVKKLQLIRPVMSLGGVESTITHPVTTSHGRVPQEEREKMGITDQLLRMSVGIEDVEDLKMDILQALN